MRVIAGKYKGHKLRQVPSNTTRPTTDKVKEAIFHKMGPFFNSGRCLDLFSGSGALAIEALSRGMEEAVCIDRSPVAIRTIKENIKKLQLENKCRIFRNDAYKALQILHKKRETFDLICIDPPYNKPVYERILTYIVKNDMINDGGYIYVEFTTDKHPDIEIESLQCIFERTYSSTTSVLLYEKVKEN